MTPAGPTRSRRLWWLLAAPVLSVIGLLILWRFAPPVSTLMIYRTITGQPVQRTWVPLDKISGTLVRAVIASEDSRFCSHGGVDWQGLSDVLDQEGAPTRGASTLTMQTAKNLFLWHGRSYIRKALEIPLAQSIGAVWPRRRTIEVYLNIAEWGPGIFGAEAAAQRYFSKPAAALTPREAALLATALPNPSVRSPGKPGRGHQYLARLIAERARAHPDITACLN